MPIHVYFGTGLRVAIFQKYDVDNLDQLKRKIEQKIEIPSNLYALYVNLEDSLKGLTKIQSNEEYMGYVDIASNEEILLIQCFIIGTSDQQVIEKCKQFGLTSELERYHVPFVSNYGFKLAYDTTIYNLRLFLYQTWNLDLEAVVLLPVRMKKHLFELKDEQFVLDLFFMAENFSYRFDDLDILLKHDYDLVTAPFPQIKYLPNYRIISTEENNEIALLSAYDDNLFTLTVLKTKLQDIFGIPAEQQMILHEDSKVRYEKLPLFFPEQPHQTITFKLLVIPSKEMEIVCKQHNIQMLEPLKVVLSCNHNLLYHFTEESTFQDLCKFVAEELSMPISSLLFFINGRRFNEYKVQLVSLCDFNYVGRFCNNVSAAQLILRPGELSEQCITREVSMMKLIKVNLQNKVLVNLSASQFERDKDVKNYMEEKYRIPVETQKIFRIDGMFEPTRVYFFEDHFYDTDKKVVTEDVLFHLSIKYSLKHDKLLDEIKNNLGIEYLRYVDVQGLTKQIRIDAAKEDVWNILDVKLFIEKDQRFFHRRQKLFFGKRKLDLLDSKCLLACYIEQEDVKSDKILLNLVLEPAAHKDVTLPVYFFAEAGGVSINILETETIGFLKTRIEDLTGVKTKFIEIKKLDGENYPDDSMLWEVSLDKEVKICKLIEVFIRTTDSEKTLRYEFGDPESQTVRMMAISLSRSEEVRQLVLDRKRTSLHICYDTLLRDVNNETIYLKNDKMRRSCSFV